MGGRKVLKIKARMSRLLRTSSRGVGGNGGTSVAGAVERTPPSWGSTGAGTVGVFRAEKERLLS
jgi:hypothetical protein